MKKKISMIIAGVIAISAAYIALAAGGAEDPLITLSYLESVLLPALKADQQAQVEVLHAEAVEKLRLEFGDGTVSPEDQTDGTEGETTPPDGMGTGETAPVASEYIAIELFEGETIRGSGGAIEVLLRTGEFIGVDPVGDKIVNMTQGIEMLDGELLFLQNLYMVPRADGRGMRCATPSGWLLVRGSYEIVAADGTVRQ